MLTILVLTSILSAVYGTRYGYVGNHIVAFDDAPTQTFSFTYPTYQEPKIWRNEQPLRDDENTTEVQTTVVPTTTTSTTTTTTPTSSITTIPTTISTTTASPTTQPTTTIPSVTTPTVVTPTTMKPRPSPLGMFWSLVLNVISIVKRIVMKVIIALMSPLFSLSSMPSSLSSSVTPERLKRAADFLQMEIKKMGSR